MINETHFINTLVTRDIICKICHQNALGHDKSKDWQGVAKSLSEQGIELSSSVTRPRVFSSLGYGFSELKKYSPVRI